MARIFMFLLLGAISSVSRAETNIFTETCSHRIIFDLCKTFPTLDKCFKDAEFFREGKKFHTIYTHGCPLQPTSYIMRIQILTEVLSTSLYQSEENLPIWLATISIDTNHSLSIEYNSLVDKLTLTLIGKPPWISSTCTQQIEFNTCSGGQLVECFKNKSVDFSQKFHTLLPQTDSCASRTGAFILKASIDDDEKEIPLFQSKNSPLWSARFNLDDVYSLIIDYNFLTDKLTLTLLGEPPWVLSTCTQRIEFNACPRRRLFNCFKYELVDFSRKFHTLLPQADSCASRTGVYLLKASIQNTELETQLSRQTMNSSLWLGAISISCAYSLHIEYNSLGDKLTLNLLGEFERLSTCSPVIELSEFSNVFSHGFHTLPEPGSCASKPNEYTLNVKISEVRFQFKFSPLGEDSFVWSSGFELPFYRITFENVFKELIIEFIGENTPSTKSTQYTCDNTIIKFDLCFDSFEFDECFRKNRGFSQLKFHTLLVPSFCKHQPTAYTLKAWTKRKIWWTTLSRVTSDSSIWHGKIVTSGSAKLTVRSLEITYKSDVDKLTLQANVPHHYYVAGFVVDENPTRRNTPNAGCYQTHFRIRLAYFNFLTSLFNFDHETLIYQTDDPDIFYFSDNKMDESRIQSPFLHGSCEKKHVDVGKVYFLIFSTLLHETSWTMKIGAYSTSPKATYFLLHDANKLVLTCPNTKAKVVSTMTMKNPYLRSVTSTKYLDIPACRSDNTFPVYAILSKEEGYNDIWSFVEYNCDRTISKQYTETHCGTCATKRSGALPALRRFLLKYNPMRVEHKFCSVTGF